jgi:hypothetical protein
MILVFIFCDDSFLAFFTHWLMECKKCKPKFFKFWRKQKMPIENKYKNTKPILQQKQNDCWAASLAWWLTAMKMANAIGRYQIYNDTIFKSYYRDDCAPTDPNYGKLSKEELIKVLSDSRWGLSVLEMPYFTGTDVTGFLKKGPVIVGYYDIGRQTYHVNVICGYDAELDMVVSMEPASRRRIFEERSVWEYSANGDFNILAWKA